MLCANILIGYGYYVESAQLRSFNLFMTDKVCVMSYLVIVGKLKLIYFLMMLGQERFAGVMIGNPKQNVI